MAMEPMVAEQDFEEIHKSIIIACIVSCNGPSLDVW